MIVTLTINYASSTLVIWTLILAAAKAKQTIFFRIWCGVSGCAVISMLMTLSNSCVLTDGQLDTTPKNLARGLEVMTG